MKKLQKLFLLLRVPLYRRGLSKGVAATVEHAAVPFEVFRTVVDVGAHRGQFALLARHMWPKAEIHCYEPQPVAHTTLHQISALIGNATVHPGALGASPGTATLHVSANSSSSSLLPIRAEQS